MNLGNTCYANAQFQCAFHIPLVRTLIECPPNVKKQKKKKAVSTARTAVSEEKEKDAEQRRQDEEGNPQEGPTEDGDGKDSISDNEQVKVEEEEEEPESVAIQALRQVFQEMETSISAVSPRRFCQVLGIPVMEQQDSQEFWKLLLPALKLPALMDLYQGCFEDYIKALDGSNREKLREEPFLDLSLDVTR